MFYKFYCATEKSLSKFALWWREIHKLKAKGSIINAAPLCLGNVSKNFPVDSMIKSRLNRYAYNFYLIMIELMLLILNGKTWCKYLDSLKKYLLG